MAPRSNDEAGNDQVVQETSRSDRNSFRDVSEEIGNKAHYNQEGGVTSIPPVACLSSREAAQVEAEQETTVSLHEHSPPGSVPFRERERTALTHSSCHTSSSSPTSGVMIQKDHDLGQSTKKNPVILNVESDDDHDEWPEISLENHQEETSVSGDTNATNITNKLKGQDHISSSIEEQCVSNSNAEERGDDEATTIDLGDLFLKHKVRQKDTLAGLAVKYNVSISDIKRANGFQTDSALYGKEWVIIPRKPFPIGPEHAAWAGMILAHYEQGMSFPLAHGSTMRKYYSANTSPIRNMDHVVIDDDHDTMLGPGHVLASRQKAEVEMMNRPSTSYKDDRLRRRKHDDSFISRTMDADENDPATRQFFDALREKDTTPLFSAEATARFNAWREKSVSTLSHGAMRELKDFHSKSIRWRDQLFSKIKKAASQPSMVPSSSGSSLKKD